MLYKFNQIISPLERELNRRIEEWGSDKAKRNQAEYEGNLNRYFALECALARVKGATTTRDISINKQRIEILAFAGHLQKGIALHSDKREQKTTLTTIKVLKEYERYLADIERDQARTKVILSKGWDEQFAR